MSSAERDEHFRLCGEFLRDNDRDRWLACLYAPAAARPYLFALYAFNAEIARIRELVSQPLLGEMRIQWWVDALEAENPGARADLMAHPTADALLATIERFALPKRALLDYLEARRFDLYDDPAPDQAFLDCYCDESCSTLFACAARILVDGPIDATTARAAEAAGKAFALTGLLRSLSWRAARRQCFVPRDLLARHGLTPEDVFARQDTPALRAAVAEWRDAARARMDVARHELSSLKAPAREAFRLLALAKHDLDALQRSASGPFEPFAPASWRRQFALWRFKP